MSAPRIAAKMQSGLLKKDVFFRISDRCIDIVREKTV